MNRRRLISLLALSPLSPGCRSATPEKLWQGVVFNNPSFIRYRGAQSLPDSVLQRMNELEKIFSLADPESELSRLNRKGSLSHPSNELFTLLERCQQFHRSSKGVYDPTIQTYWKWLSEQNQEGQIPGEKERQEKLAMVDFSKVALSENRIALNGTQLTLNSVAQGFLTDQITLLLQQSGLASALVNLGEFRAFGASYQVEIRHPSSPKRVLATIPLQDRSLAVSSGAGYRMSASGKDNHLLSPESGQSPPPLRTVAVFAPDATTADAWATILSLEPKLEEALPPDCEVKFW